ncbi:MAG TPA: electron transfer flavoprotein subunit beta/FixA family protein [Bdellovibrionales bacterium]|mgnify:CR=1 FL=1|nr:electron transfer flavoprotein subunit beta/FixA family protein [Bdellovibrionales bacterium]
MRIFVCIKQVPDTETRIQIKSDKSGIEETGVKWVMNPYDEYAVEEAIKIRDAKGGGQVTVVSVGPKARVSESLRTAMAMGADDAIVIDTSDYLDSYWTGKALGQAIQKEGAFDLVLTGKLAIDDNAAAVPQIVAETLGIPHVTVVSKLGTEGAWVAEREIEGGAREIFEVQGPCVLAANKGLNTPRYASLPGIMKAKKKPLKEIALGDLGIQSSHLKTRLKDFQLPPEKPAVKMVAGDPATQAKELVRLLLEEAKVL